MSFAKITLKGRLGKEPELKQVGQSQVCKLSVATSERWIDQQRIPTTDPKQRMVEAKTLIEHNHALKARYH